MFFDIAEDSFNVDLADVQQYIDSQHSAPLAAYIAVPLFGEPIPRGHIELLNEDIPVIVDAAQAFGTSGLDAIHGKLPATAITLSFFPSKNLGAFGDAGAVICDSVELANRIRSLRRHGMGLDKYENNAIGGNFRMDEIQAAILETGLLYIDHRLERRQEIADFYFESLADVKPAIRLPRNHRGHSFNQFVLSVLFDYRDPLKEWLRKVGIGSAVYYPKSLDMQKCFADFQSPFNRVYPNATVATRASLAIPIFPELTFEEIEYVANRILEF
jgi:dTDP-4-amino-4,6-dideoxygalactose transaminase